MSTALATLLNLPTELKVVVMRTIYGIVIGLVITVASLVGVISFISRILGLVEWVFSSIAIALLYIPTIVIARRLGATRRYDVYIRGVSTYFASIVLLNIVIASQ